MGEELEKKQDLRARIARLEEDIRKMTEDSAHGEDEEYRLGEVTSVVFPAWDIRYKRPQIFSKEDRNIIEEGEWCHPEMKGTGRDIAIVFPSDKKIVECD